MKRAIPLLAGALLFGALMTPQGRQRPLQEDEPQRPFPGGKDLKDELLKAEHEKSIKDAEQLIKLSQELRDELEKNTRYVLSISSIKKTEEIEKLAKRIRGRIQR
jgi:hypothetical protein